MDLRTDTRPSATVHAAPARKHRWDHDNVVVVSAHDSTTGCELHERTCVLCGMVRITNLERAQAEDVA